MARKKGWWESELAQSLVTAADLAARGAPALPTRPAESLPPPLPSQQPFPPAIPAEVAGAGGNTPLSPPAGGWLSGAAGQNAAIGAVAGMGSIPGMAGGALGGALGGPIGGIVGSAIGRGVGTVAEAAMSQYSQADLSSYTPGGARSSPMSTGDPNQIANLLGQVVSATSRMANVGIKTTSGKPNHL